MSKKIIVLDFDNVICDDHYVYPLNENRLTQFISTTEKGESPTGKTLLMKKT